MDMDLTQIKKGKKFKNFHELCDALGVPFKKGNGRKTLIDEMNRFFTFEKLDGKQTLVITSVKSSPKIRMTYSGGVYAPYSVPLLCKILDTAHASDNYLVVSYGALAKLMGLCNSNYNNHKFINSFVRTNFSHLSHHECKAVKDKFLETSLARQKRIIRSTLTQLRESGIISYTQAFRGISYDGLVMKEISDTVNSRRIVNYETLDLQYGGYNASYDNLTLHEEMTYMHNCYDVMRELGYTKLNELINGGKRGEYNQALRRKTINEQNYYNIYEVFIIKPLIHNPIHYQRSIAPEFCALNNLVHKKSCETNIKFKVQDDRLKAVNEAYVKMCDGLLEIPNKKALTANDIRKPIGIYLENDDLPFSQFYISPDMELSSFVNMIMKSINSSEIQSNIDE